MAEEKGISWSTPMAVVLFGTGTVAVVVGLMMAGVVAGASGATSPAWLLGLALIDIPAGIILLKRGETTLGVITLYLGTILCVGAGVTSLIHTFAPGDPIPAGFEAWSWIAVGAFLLCLMPAVAKLPWTVFLFLCVVLGVGLVLWGVGLLQGVSGLMKIGGWCTFAFAVFCYYAGMAFLTNEAYGREVLPMGQPLAKSSQVEMQAARAA